MFTLEDVLHFARQSSNWSDTAPNSLSTLSLASSNIRCNSTFCTKKTRNKLIPNVHDAVVCFLVMPGKVLNCLIKYNLINALECYMNRQYSKHIIIVTTI